MTRLARFAGSRSWVPTIGRAAALGLLVAGMFGAGVTFAESADDTFTGPSAAGERQMLPMHTNRTFFRSLTAGSLQSGFGPYSPTPSSPAIMRMARIARTLLPASLRRGENAAMANLPGTTETMPPPTPVPRMTPNALAAPAPAPSRDSESVKQSASLAKRNARSSSASRSCSVAMPPWSWMPRGCCWASPGG